MERSIYTIPEKLVNGLFRGFSQTDLFGWQYWAVIGAGFLMLLGRPTGVFSHFNREGLLKLKDKVLEPKFRSSPMLPFLLLPIGYLAFSLITLLGGSDLAIKNARYLMTIQPFVSALAALVLVSFIEVEREQVK
jgi:hypothetical protein